MVTTTQNNDFGPSSLPLTPAGGPSNIAGDRLISKKEVTRLTSLSGTTIWRLARAGQFPAPIQLSRGRVAFLQSQVTAWIIARAGIAA
jgi:predicted DNA-binding transcriptional regulator AlpA